MQAVDRLTRTAADDDGTDHIGFETPRSGVATPQPDLQDKRLPGILTYYGQVREDPSVSEASTPLRSLPEKVPSSDEKQVSPHKPASSTLQSREPAQHSVPDGDSSAKTPSVSSGERPSALPSIVKQEFQAGHPYPTPPTSQSPSRKSTVHEGENRSEEEVPAATTVPETSSRSQSATAQSQSPDIISPPESAPSKCNSPSAALEAVSELKEVLSKSTITSPDLSTQSSNKWYSLDGLKELTRGVFKSGPPTPTRALSVAQPSLTEGRQTPSRTSNDSADASGTQTPRGAAQAPAPKGKLIIKIAEARGLRRSRDPYVVVVFQRNELISGGPQPADDLEAISASPATIGSIPIQRQASDSGRPPMAIPMRSRQSSNTSISDYNSFRNRPARLSFTNPKWDAEAVL